MGSVSHKARLVRLERLAAKEDHMSASPPQRPANAAKGPAKESKAPLRLLAEPAVEARTSLSRMTIWRLIKEGNFPASISISANRRAWVESEVEDWIAAQIAKRDAAGS